MLLVLFHFDLFYVGISVSKPEEARLVEENQRLRVEIEKLRVKLVLAEVKNGGTTYAQICKLFHCKIGLKARKPVFRVSE